jgi:hypothetical protein
MKDVFDSLDLFRIPFQFNIENKQLFSTIISKALSLIFIVISILVLILNLDSMISRKNITISNYRTSLSAEDMFELNNSNNFFAFSFISNDFSYSLNETNDKYYKYLKVLAHIYNSSDDLSYDLLIHDCPDTFKIGIYSNQTFQTKKCVNFMNYQLRGNLFDNFKQYSTFDLMVNFDKNQYLLDYPNDTLPSTYGFLNYYFPYSTLLLEKFDNSFNINFGRDYQTLVADTSQYYLLFFSRDEIHTYYDYFDSKKVSIDIVHSISYNLNYYGDSNPDYIIKMCFNLSPIKSVYMRKYMNIQDVINNVNSIISIVSIVFGIIASSFNQMKLKQKIIEEIFILNTNDVNNCIFIINLVQNEEKMNKNSRNSLKKRSELIKINTQKKVSFSDYFLLNAKFLCCKLKHDEIRKKRDYELIISKFNSLIQIKEILTTLNYVKNLKRMFLTKHKWIDEKIILNDSKSFIRKEKPFIPKTWITKRRLITKKKKNFELIDSNN